MYFFFRYIVGNLQNIKGKDGEANREIGCSFQGKLVKYIFFRLGGYLSYKVNDF